LDDDDLRLVLWRYRDDHQRRRSISFDGELDPPEIVDGDVEIDSMLGADPVRCVVTTTTVPIG
jgi:hypothetical protein